MISHIVAFCGLFGPSAFDKQFFDLVAEIASDKSKWESAHSVFNEIRKKSLNFPIDSPNWLEYNFLEACLKGIYNVGRFTAPFDPDSSYQIIPRAFKLALVKHISDAEVISIIRP